MTQPTKQSLEELYLGQGLSMRACADVLGSTHGSVSWLFKKYSIPRRKNVVGFKSMEHPSGKTASGWKGGKVDVACNSCGKILSRFPSCVRSEVFCSMECKKSLTARNYIGQKFGMLTVIKFEGTGKYYRQLFKCSCDCGGEKVVSSNNLKSGGTTSCGCKDLRGEKSPKYKRVEVTCCFCGKLFKVHPSRSINYANLACSKECRSNWQSETRSGENSPKWVDKVKISCSFCGKVIEMLPRRADLYDSHFCNKDCNSQWRVENYKGNNNPNYRGGTQEMRKVRSRISCGMRKAIKDQKAGRSWEHFVDYDLTELIERLKSTLPEGYSWEDDFVKAKGVLHIDHIRPMSSFSFESPYDSEFRKCFSLDNLQLLPAIENMRKSGKLDYYANQ